MNQKEVRIRYNSRFRRKKKREIKRTEVPICLIYCFRVFCVFLEAVLISRKGNVFAGSMWEVSVQNSYVAMFSGRGKEKIEKLLAVGEKKKRGKKKIDTGVFFFVRNVSRI